MQSAPYVVYLLALVTQGLGQLMFFHKLGVQSSTI
jgi:hypothetical protein